MKLLYILYMCMAYSNGMDVLLFNQEEEEKQHTEKQTQQPKQKKTVASGQKVHWLGQVVLVSKISYL